MSDVIECPRCHHNVVIVDSICPECKHEVLEEHLHVTYLDDDHEFEDEQSVELSIEEMISNHYRCPKCKHDECNVKEVAMTGTGLSKLMDIQYNHYLFVSCLNCANVVIYDPDILRGTRHLGS